MILIIGLFVYCLKIKVAVVLYLKMFIICPSPSRHSGFVGICHPRSRRNFPWVPD